MASVDREAMLARLGFATLAELTDAALPSSIRDGDLSGLPDPVDEAGTQRRLAQLAAANFPGHALIGLGFHGTVTPPAIRRLVLENPAWYTAYTPYQPEISQGRLELLMVFQTMIADLTGLPVAGASLLDEGTAVAEAVALARRANKRGSAVVVDPDILPSSLGVLRTRAQALGVDVEVACGLLSGAKLEDAFAVVVQVPGTDGRLPSPDELRQLADAAHTAGALVIAACDPLALTLCASPGSWGADVAVGSTQRFGVPLFFGGPHAGYLAVRSGLERQLPGRLVGQSVDSCGTPAFRLALQTREQHIRREKATSNICTAQVLLAIAAALYPVWHGPDGVTAIAAAIHDRARRLAAALRAAGFESAHEQFFDTLTVKAPGRALALVAAARDQGFHLRLVDADTIGVSIGEDLDDGLLAQVASVFGAKLTDARLGGLAGHVRSEPLWPHPVFHDYHDETKFLRYLRALSDRDFALDRGMIPLGSCTMKLNPAAAMEPISYPGFANLHPYVPTADAAGFLELISELCGWLAVVSGYDAVSVQPNAGSQGEFAGLLAIRSWHIANGRPDRTVCLIPASAHGTNAASAALAGMSVVVVATSPDGSIDLADLKAKLTAHDGKVAAIMVTYPSTHGVFEDGIGEVCALVHAAGGQVYVDGANLNALLGLARPGKFGADVSHLNLHKTFAIPHGGGGPGVGPVAVRGHLAPYLPSHAPGSPVGPVSSAPFGSAGVLPISYAYLMMSGAHGLHAASSGAILAANYVARRLSEAYPILYTGANGLVAHECIVDLRELTHSTGVTVDDVAKRLVDYGFHAPTMSFPVPGTLMVEPTESEPLGELDRFCDAMLAIRAEIDLVGQGHWPSDDNPLRNAPHPQAVVLAEEWTHPYSRAIAAVAGGVRPGPLAAGGRDKYWPPVGRVDGARGDRQLVAVLPKE